MTRTTIYLPGGLALALTAVAWAVDAGSASAQTRQHGVRATQTPKQTSGQNNQSGKKNTPTLRPGTQGNQPTNPPGGYRYPVNPRPLGPYTGPGSRYPVVVNPTLGTPSLVATPTANFGFVNTGNLGFVTPGLGTPGFGLPAVGGLGYGTPGFGYPSLTTSTFGYPTLGTLGLGFPSLTSSGLRYPTLGTLGLGGLGFGTPGLGAISGLPFPSLSGRGPAYTSPKDYYLTNLYNSNPYTSPLGTFLSPYASPLSGLYPFTNPYLTLPGSPWYNPFSPYANLFNSPFSNPFATPFMNPFSNPFANPYSPFAQLPYSPYLTPNLYPQTVFGPPVPSLLMQPSYPSLLNLYPNAAPLIYQQPGLLGVGPLGGFGGFGAGSLGGGVSGNDSFGPTLPVSRPGY
jgi:hypothetical protein